MAKASIKSQKVTYLLELTKEEAKTLSILAQLVCGGMNTRRKHINDIASELRACGAYTPSGVLANDGIDARGSVEFRGAISDE